MDESYQGHLKTGNTFPLNKKNTPHIPRKASCPPLGRTDRHFESTSKRTFLGLPDLVGYLIVKWVTIATRPQPS